MPITNAYMAEWAGEYQWTVQGLPVDLYTFVEDNVAALPALEGWHLGHYRAGDRTIALLTCRVPRPESLPGRPGVVYHHALLADGRANPAGLEKALRARYRDPVGFTRDLYDRIAQEAGLARTSEDVINAARPLLNSVAIHSLTYVPTSEDPVPSFEKTALNLLRVNAVLMVILVGLGISHVVLLRSVRIKLNSVMVSDTTVANASNDSATVDSTAPAPIPTAPVGSLEQTLQTGDLYVVDSLRSGSAFFDDPPTRKLIAELQHFLDRHQTWRVAVGVYTDTQGNETDNDRTSVARAEVLEQRIRQGGEYGDRLVVTGQGENETPSPPGKPPIRSRARRIVVSTSPAP